MTTIKRGIIWLGILALAVGLHSAMVLNNTDDIFPPPNLNPGSMVRTASYGQPLIRNCMIEGAGRFLDSYGEAMLLLREYEESGNAAFDFTEAASKAEAALQKLADSRTAYAEALNAAEKLEYLEYYKNKLLQFDYDACITRKSLKTSIAEEVKGFLQVSDVIGLYRRNIERIDDIISVLKRICEDLEKGVKSDVTLYWEVLQKYSETALFGNYATVLSREAFGK